LQLRVFVGWFVTGIVFDRFRCLFIFLFLCFFVSFSARLRANGWTDLHEIFREGVESPRDDLIQFWVNSEKPRDAAMLISLSAFVNITSNRLFWQSRAAI